MTIVAAALLVAFAVPWSLFLVWMFSRIAERSLKHALSRQRLLRHSARLGCEDPKLADPNRGVPVRKSALPPSLSPSLRYTDEHRREAKRLRAREAERAKIEGGDPGRTKGAAIGRGRPGEAAGGD